MSGMQQLIEYIGHHAYLAGGTFVALVTVVAYEAYLQMQAFAALSSMQAVRLMNQGALVIDLRRKELFDAGRIGDARNMPVANLDSQLEGLKKWRDKTVITYCESGRDGAIAARTLSKRGFTKVYNLDGGMNAWVKDNMPVIRASGGK